LKGDIAGIPKPVAIGGVILAVVLGLYLRARNANSATSTGAGSGASQQPSTDNSDYEPPLDQSSDYSSPYYTTADGGDLNSIDPTTGYSYAQDIANLTSGLNGLSATASDTPTTTTSAVAPSAQTPVVINLSSTAVKAAAPKKASPATKATAKNRTPGKPKVSARPKSHIPTKKAGNG
jgi:hypothetical protein